MPDISEPGQWTCGWRVDKFHEPTPGDPAPTPYETVHIDGNLLTYGGVSTIWEMVSGTQGTTTADQTFTYFNTTRACLGVGDSAVAVSGTQTDLQAAAGTSHQLRKNMTSGTYPIHADSTSAVAAQTVTYQSNFTTAEANFAWNEWGLFNSSVAATGRMLNRKVDSAPGTKTSADSWVLTCTISIA